MASGTPDRDLTLLIAHPDDELLFLWPFLSQAKRIVCVGSDENNPERAWCARRLEALRVIGSETGIEIECLNANSEFYRLPTRDGTLKALAGRVLKALADSQAVATHNAWGEYGHLDHILCHQIARACGKRILTTDIAEDVNWLPVRRWPKRWEPRTEHVLDMQMFERLKVHYDRLGCWTWSRPPVSKCGVIEC
jgi:LmbE family N-acetylglucosaminyl deacetylase